VSRIVIALVTSLLFAAAPARAFPFYVIFHLTGDATDPMNSGQASTGFFAFDGKIPEDGPRMDIPLFFPETLIAFHWGGVDWDQTSAYVYDLAFNGAQYDGLLHGWDMFSGDPFHGNAGLDQTFQLKAGSVDPYDPAAGWVVLWYTNATGSYRTEGSWYWSSTAPGPVVDAPEPGGLAVVGLMGVMCGRRRRSHG